MINTTDRLNARGIKIMTVVADANGNALELPKAEAVALAATIPGATISENKYKGISPKRAKELSRRGAKVLPVPFVYFVRIK